MVSIFPSALMNIFPVTCVKLVQSLWLNEESHLFVVPASHRKDSLHATDISFFKIEMRKYVVYNHRNKVSVSHMAVAIYGFLPTPQLIIIIIRVFMIF